MTEVAAGDAAVLGAVVQVGGVKLVGVVGDGTGSDSSPCKSSGRSSFRQRKINRLSGGAKRKYEPFEEPLPIQYRITANQVYERLQLPPDSLAASWRDYGDHSVVIATYPNRPKPPGLFDTVPISRSPHEPLVPATRSAEPKVRRQREIMQRDLTVRVARKQLGYCIGREIKEPSLEELAQINAKIQTVFPDRSLTAAEVKCWCYHERPLVGDVHKYYTDALAAYQRNSNDVIDLLVPEQGRFANLGPERMLQLRLLSRAIRTNPFEERDGGLYELPDLHLLKSIWPCDVDTSESITVTKGDKSIKLSPLASNIYQSNFTQLKAVCKLLSKQSEVGRRIKQSLSLPRPPEEPKRKKLRDEISLTMLPATPTSAQLIPRDASGLQAIVRDKVAAALRVLSMDDLQRVAKAVGSRLLSASRDEVERATFEGFFDGVPLPSTQIPPEQAPQFQLQPPTQPADQAEQNLNLNPPATPTGSSAGVVYGGVLAAQQQGGHVGSGAQPQQLHQLQQVLPHPPPPPPA